MLKLFRRFRKFQLMENNTGKYFKYAIGEITLVMIGILLALQVNNWNEGRKIKEQQLTFMTSLKKDLTADTTYLKDYLAKIKLSYQKLKQERDRVNQKSFNKDSLINFVKNDINVFMVSFEGFNNNTYESIKMSGKIDLLNEPLKNNLFELSVIQESGFEVYENLRNDYFDEIESLNAKYPIAVSFSFLKKNSHSITIWSDIDEKDLLLQLNSWGTGKANFYNNITKNFTNALEKTKTVLSLIE